MRVLLFSSALFLAGCLAESDGPGPQSAESITPKISSVVISPDAVLYMQGDGSVSVEAQVSYVDGDMDIEHMEVDMPDGSSQLIPLMPLSTTSGTISAKFTVSTTEAGTFTFPICLLDHAGHVSNHLSADLDVQYPVPQIESLDPDRVAAGSINFYLSVTGTGFMDGSVVTWGGANRTTQYVSNKEVVAFIPTTDLTEPRTVGVRVHNPSPTAGHSNELPFIVAESQDPEPISFPIRITEPMIGLNPDGPSVNGGLTWAGGFVVFASRASNLVAGDTNGFYDLFVRKTCLEFPDGCAPSTTRAVMGVDGQEPNGDIGWTVTSPEDSLAVSFLGRHAAFVSSASNLVPGDTNGVDDVFVIDTCPVAPTTTCIAALERVSLADGGAQSTMAASHPAVAGGGRYVVFVSADPDLVAGDTNGVADVFLRDTCRGVTEACTPSTIRVSVAGNGGQANGASGEPSLTGRYVAFSSLASNLVAGDSNGLQDVFLRDTCIGEDDCVPSTRLISVGHLGEPANGASSAPQLPVPLADYHGRFVVFVSDATNLVDGDTNAASDVFERDLCTGIDGCTPYTTRMSVTSTGGQIAGDSWGADFVTWSGATVPFVTAVDGVVPEDSNGLADVYVRHHCPIGDDFCAPFTLLASHGAGGAQADGASYAPRMPNDLFGPWAISFISEASNILPDAVPVPNEGNIYLDTPY